MQFMGFRPIGPGFELVDGFTEQDAKAPEALWTPQEARRILSHPAAHSPSDDSADARHTFVALPPQVESAVVPVAQPLGKGRLALRLASLYSKSDQSVVDFANAWGPLRHGDHVWGPSASAFYTQGTRLSVWRDDIWELVVATQLARYLRLEGAAQKLVDKGYLPPGIRVPLVGGQRFDLSDFFRFEEDDEDIRVSMRVELPGSKKFKWVLLLDTAVGFRSGLRDIAEDRDTVTLGWAYLARVVGERLGGVTATAHASNDNGGLALDLQCADLLSWIWFDLAEALTREGGLRTCLWCGKLTQWKVRSTTDETNRQRERKVVQSSRHYCSDACRMKAQRAGHSARPRRSNNPASAVETPDSL